MPAECDLTSHQQLALTPQDPTNCLMFAYVRFVFDSKVTQKADDSPPSMQDALQDAVVNSVVLGLFESHHSWPGWLSSQ